MNPQFETFLKHFAADKHEKQQLTRLKVQQRRELLVNNNSIRSGSSLPVESNPPILAGEKYSSMCELKNKRLEQ